MEKKCWRLWSKKYLRPGNLVLQIIWWLIETAAEHFFTIARTKIRLHLSLIR